MSRLKAVSIERENCWRSLIEQADAQTTHVGQGRPAHRDAELTGWTPTGQRIFSGRIEAAAVDKAVLSKSAVTPYLLSCLLRTPAPPLPAMLLVLMSGSCNLAQRNRSCTLHPGAWCLVDPLQTIQACCFEAHSEYLVLTLERPSDPERLGLIEQGVARCWDAKTGISRILLATLTETFRQMNRVGLSGTKSLEHALTCVAWDAVREQLEAPSPRERRDVLRARIKTYIERHVADPELSVDSIAQGCGTSVRSLHRAFKADPAGSVSGYVWTRRLSHCAASLRDPEQAHRSITRICFSWGFNSTSHFSRLFKEQFGTAPREYRTARSTAA